MRSFVTSFLISMVALCSTDSISLAVNKTVLSSEGTNPSGSAAIHRRFPFTWRRAHFPIIPPRLRQETTTTTTSTTTPLPSHQNDKPLDIFEISSSDNSPAVVWPFPRKPISRRFRTTSATTSAPRVLQKLLEPKPTRPAIYSLDGFVPKPSIQRISTTEAPPEIRRAYNQLLNEGRRRKKGRQSLYEDDDDQEEKYRLNRRKKPVSRYRSFARKGVPGVDYPVHVRIPETDFDCDTRPGTGVYADPQTDCQVWHMCPGGTSIPRHSFLCPNGTIFNELRRICDWWYNVRCEKDLERKKRSLMEISLDVDTRPIVNDFFVDYDY